jgi:hypothetical protein
MGRGVALLVAVGATWATASSASAARAGIARLLVGSGPADAEADGVEDVKDSRPDLYRSRHNGCAKHHDD